MRLKLSGPVATGILIASCIGILVAGYLYVRDPPRVTPEQTREMMNKANSRPKPPLPATATPGANQKSTVPTRN
jgi:hypothetical protein